MQKEIDKIRARKQFTIARIAISELQPMKKNVEGKHLHRQRSLAVRRSGITAFSRNANRTMDIKVQTDVSPKVKWVWALQTFCHELRSYNGFSLW